MSAPTVALSAEEMILLALHKQRLADPAPAGALLPVAEDLLGLHATGAQSPYLQLLARVRDFRAEQLDAVLDSGRAVKVPCMRTTLFVQSAAILPVVFAATRRVRAQGRERYLAAYQLTGLDYERLARRVEEAVAGRALDALSLQQALGTDRPITPVIILMCDDGRLLRWRGAAGWRSARPTYRLFTEVLPDVRLDRCDERDAIHVLVDWYVRRYGPVSSDDVAWWTGLGARAIRDALADNPAIRQVGIHLLHEADAALRPKRRAEPQVALLPVLDPYLQGYHHRERFIDPRREPFVIDRGGNATSVILVDGRVAGVWDFGRQGRKAELRIHFFGRPSAEIQARVEALATAIATFLGAPAALIRQVLQMAPLTARTAGSVLSPLTPARK